MSRESVLKWCEKYRPDGAKYRTPKQIVSEILKYTPAQKAKQEKGMRELAKWARSLKPKK